MSKMIILKWTKCQNISFDLEKKMNEKFLYDKKIFHTHTIMTSTKEVLFSKLDDTVSSSDDKVTVIGAGDVGVTVAVCTAMQELSSDIVLVDVNIDQMEGESKDPKQSSSFMHTNIRSSQDFMETVGSKVCVIAAGAIPAPGETRLDLVHKNTNIMKSIIPRFTKYSPEAVLIVITNPVDVMTWVAWKVSGFPKHRVIGIGTVLDSARFSYLAGEKLGVSAESVDGLIIGEHGESSVAVWSHLNVRGIRLRDINPNIAKPEDTEEWKCLHKKVIEAGSNCFTNWEIGMCTVDLVKAVLKNTNRILSVSTYIKGNCGIEHEIFLSLPAVLGKNGVSNIVQLDLNTEETCQLKFSAHKILELISQVKI